MSWLAAHWLDLIQSAGIVGGLLFNGWALHRDGQAQRAANLLKLTEQHRDIWREMFSRPGLARVLRPDADLLTDPVTDEETLFVTLLILHLNTAFSAVRAGVLRAPEGITPDIRGFFSLPIPRAAWEKARHLHDREFVRFVEAKIGGNSRPSR